MLVWYKLDNFSVILILFFLLINIVQLLLYINAIFIYLESEKSLDSQEIELAFRKDRNSDDYSSINEKSPFILDED